MNLRTAVLVLMSMSFALVGCPAKETSQSESATESEEQDRPARRPAKKPVGPGLKRISVSLAQSKSWRLPPATFSFTYPDEATLSLAKAGRQNPYYALVELYRGKKISESVSVSHVDLKGGPPAKWDRLAPVVMKRLQTAMQGQLPGMVILASGKAPFGGKDLYQFRAEFEITDPNMGDLGKYRTVWVALLPGPKSSSPNGASLTMTVRQGSGSKVTTWQDFSSKGLMGQIWRSFEFASAGSLSP